MALTVAVYGKRGLKRGPAISSGASFRAIEDLLVHRLRFLPPGPLTGTEPRYTVEQVIFWDGQFSAWTPKYDPWTIEVRAPGHQPHRFYVRDGEAHEVWLSP